MTRSGIVTIIGNPNVGKSTLMNRFVGYKVSIVTHKEQTTRRQIQGVLTEGETQVVFVDTPGIFQAQKTLDRAMVKAAHQATKGVDLIMFMTTGDLTLLDKLHPHCVIINKIDKIPQAKIQEMREKLKDVTVFEISALNGDGIDSLKEYIFDKMPEHPFLYPEDQLTNINQKIWAAEITREKAMLNLHQELPYELYVETEQYEITDKGQFKIYQSIVVARESLKGMVLGQKGQMIKTIGEESRKEMQAHLGGKVHLFLHVKVREKWQEKAYVLKELGII